MSEPDVLSWYKGNLAWLKARTVLLVRHGSQAYGTNIETSDLDLKGIAIPTDPYFLGSLHHFEQAESKNPDAVIYDIRKFVTLAANCNPNIIEVLFVDDKDVLLSSWVSDRLRAIRDVFISKKAQYSFSGYAMSQLKRIRTHRKWLLDPPKDLPSRLSYGLTEQYKIPKDDLAAIDSLVRKEEDKLGGEGWTKDKVLEKEEALVTHIATELQFDARVIPIILAERRYGTAVRTWNSYQSWKHERNPKRAELEAKYGYDTKHGMHLVRLMRMSMEILRDKKVIVKRPDADELLSIRNGAWSYEKLVEWAEGVEVDLATVAANSKLPKEPNRAYIDEQLVDIVYKYLSLNPGE